jgi:hypothetical protein
MIAAKMDRSLFEFFSDIDPRVQLWAATHTLEIAEPDALAKLTMLVESRKPLVSMTARYTIEAWKRGDLSFRRADRVPETT